MNAYYKWSGLAGTIGLLAAIFCTISAPATARTTCRAHDTSPEVHIKTNNGKLTIHNGFSRSQLANKQGQRKVSGGKKGLWRPVGLTLTELEFFLSVRVTATPAAKGRYCGHLESVEATIGYEKLTVYVARKYRPGSCHYRSIMDHEQLHVSIFRNTLAQFSPRVERRLRRAAAAMRPIVSSSADQAANRMQRKLQNEIKPLFREMNRVLDAANAKLDTPENYRREQARCNGW